LVQRHHAAFPDESEVALVVTKQLAGSRAIFEPRAPRLMDQGRPFERLSRLLARELLRRQPPQLLVNNRQQPVRCVDVATGDDLQELSELIYQE
jgi:hypothetical protein